MCPSKAPGYDGMTAGFFQHYWDTMAGDICQTAKSFFHLRTLLNTGLARVEISSKLSLQSKLGDLLCRSSKQSLPKTNASRAKAIITSELSLFSKLGIITVLKLGRWATVGGNPEGCQGTKGDLHIRVPSYSRGWRCRQLMMGN
ncbi:hypothetical protein Acr_00g0081930 [Actinidia rufa]|uniref:Uncharacterized protein n=1 Tax=Actinidia rufa TaxID=165716 RepID=A0A7J0DUT0_9ERIC|nr:hypothetical protein Acr_00g0081930 [Actinidia rufa]